MDFDAIVLRNYLLATLVLNESRYREFHRVDSFGKKNGKILMLAKPLEKNIEKRYILTEAIGKILRKGKCWQNQLKKGFW